MDFTTKFGFPKPFLGERGANKAHEFADAMENADAILASHEHTGGAGGQISHTNLSDIGTHSHTQIDDHLSARDNPHAVNKSQVGLGNVTDDAQLKRKAGDITSFAEKGTPVSTDLVLIEDSADNYNKKKVNIGNLPTGGGGEANTASNQGAGGVGLFHAKVGIDLQFKNINAGSNRLTITDDIVNQEVDIDVVPENINQQSLSGAGVNTHAQIDSHLANTSNPHSVTAAQVGLGSVTNDAQLKRQASDITSFTEKGTPVSTDLVLIEDSADNFNKKKVQIGNLPTGGGGEANTASNQGVGGVGLFHAKVGIDLQFKNINAGSNRLSVTDDIVNQEVDIDVVPENINHQSLSGAGANTHAQIDSHLTSTSNPHSVTAAQVGAIANATDTVKDSHIDWGTATGQVSADVIPDGATKVIPTAVQETNWDSHLSDTSNPHAVNKSQVGLGNVTDDAQLTREAGDIFNSFPEKTAPQSDDVLLIEDGAAGYAKKKVRVTNLPGNAKVNFSPSQLSDDCFQGDTFSGTAGETLAPWDFLYLKSDGKWWKAKADAAVTCPAQGVAVTAANADGPVTILFCGFFRDDGGTPLAVGGLIYLSPASAGSITGVLPNTTGNQVQILGYALAPQIRVVNPNLMLIEVP